MPWVYSYECLKKPFVANLNSFPFKNTDCSEFDKAVVLKTTLRDAFTVDDK